MCLVCDASRMEFGQFVSGGIEVDGLLQASDFFLGACCEQGELTGMDREHVTSQARQTPVGSSRGRRSSRPFFDGHIQDRRKVRILRDDDAVGQSPGDGSDLDVDLLHGTASPSQLQEDSSVFSSRFGGVRDFGCRAITFCLPVSSRRLPPVARPNAGLPRRGEPRGDTHGE